MPSPSICGLWLYSQTYEVFHCSTPEDILRLLGTRAECQKRWEKDGATLVDKLRIEYEDSLFWKCGVSGAKRLDVNLTKTVTHKWVILANHSMSRITFSFGPTQGHVYIIWLFTTKRRSHHFCFFNNAIAQRYKLTCIPKNHAIFLLLVCRLRKSLIKKRWASYNIATWMPSNFHVRSS